MHHIIVNTEWTISKVLKTNTRNYDDDVSM